MIKRNDQAFFVILCLTWGSTWLAIKIGVNEAPPIIFAGTRFLVAGALFYHEMISVSEIIGTLVILLGILVIRYAKSIKEK